MISIQVKTIDHEGLSIICVWGKTNLGEIYEAIGANIAGIHPQERFEEIKRHIYYEMGIDDRR